MDINFMNPEGYLNWDIGQLAGALQIDEKSVNEYFTDGRRVAFIIERRLCSKLGYRLAAS